MNFRQNKNIIVIIILVTALNIIMGVSDVRPGSGKHLDGSIASSSEIKNAFIITFLIAVPIISLLLGSIITPLLNLFNRPQEFFKVVLWSILTINILVLALQFVGFIMMY